MLYKKHDVCSCYVTFKVHGYKKKFTLLNTTADSFHWQILSNDSLGEVCPVRGNYAELTAN